MQHKLCSYLDGKAKRDDDGFSSVKAIKLLNFEFLIALGEDPRVDKYLKLSLVIAFSFFSEAFKLHV